MYFLAHRLAEGRNCMLRGRINAE